MLNDRDQESSKTGYKVQVRRGIKGSAETDLERRWRNAGETVYDTLAQARLEASKAAIMFSPGFREWRVMEVKVSQHGESWVNVAWLHQGHRSVEAT